MVEAKAQLLVRGDAPCERVVNAFDGSHSGQEKYP